MAETKPIERLIWPTSVGTQLPIPAGFLSTALATDHLSSDGIFLARDGLIPLLWFFRLGPSAGDRYTVIASGS